ncbi:hypothetical protein SAMN05216337_104572 [Bradyrhizobium brasilense]|uniref:Uncharacterized protein n=1 Tax=Bradyrhizobium brasilense TaxID=1419277 RepID=A0A1G7IL77_9BRAD|nr:hypothetical protein SAMN05216337_104572 [Bradyrhizobium brasilense]
MACAWLRALGPSGSVGDHREPVIDPSLGPAHLDRYEPVIHLM